MGEREKSSLERVLEASDDRAPAPKTPRQLIESCQGLVRTIAWKVHQKLPASVELDDVISYGQLGLAQAARDFDAKRGGQFTTYAYYRVRGAIFDGLSKMSWFSRHDYHKAKYEQQATEVLKQNAEEAGDATAASVEEDARWMAGVTTTLSMVYLASGGSEGEGGAGSTLVDDTAPAPPVAAAAAELRDKLRELIETLPPESATLIKAAYFEGVTLQEAGQRLGISKAWASRLHARALQKLAQSLRHMEVSR